jgi:hypothetical protein
MITYLWGFGQISLQTGGAVKVPRDIQIDPEPFTIQEG